MRVQRHVVVETDEGVPLSLAGVAEFVERCRAAGIPDDALVNHDPMLAHRPMTFRVVWAEAL